MAHVSGEHNPSHPLVSVIVPTFNRSHLLGAAVNSVLEQTYPNIELIVIDDGSTDKTGQVVSSFGADVRYMYQQNRGPSAARNRGISISNGSYLIFLDDDDLLKPTMVERTVGLVENASGDVGAAHVDYEYFGANESQRLAMPRKPRRGPETIDRLVKANFIPINTALLRRKCVEAIGGFDDGLRGYEDWDFLLRAALAGYRFLFVPEQLALIRLHQGRLSSDSVAIARSAVRMISKLELQVASRPALARSLRRSLAERRILLALTLALEGFDREGREELAASVPIGITLAAQKVVARGVMSWGGTEVLRRFRNFLEFALTL